MPQVAPFPTTTKLIILRPSEFLVKFKISLAFENSKPTKDNLSKDERKAWKESQVDTSVLILPADKGRCTVILYREGYM